MQNRHSVVKGVWEYSASRLVKEGALTSGMRVTLRREPNNQYDRNAASVYCGRSKLGYLARNLAAEVVSYLDSGGKYSGVITNVGQQTYKGSKYPTVSVDFSFDDLRTPSGAEALFQAATGFVGVRGVYLVFNTVENRGYVGSTTDVGQRFRQHISHLINGQHVNHKMSLAWLTHGPQSFQLSLIERIEGADLLEREAHHIQRLGTHANGYNHSADGIGHVPARAEYIAKISNQAYSGEPSVAISTPLSPPVPQQNGETYLLNCPYCNEKLKSGHVVVKTEVRCPTCAREFFIKP